MKNSVLFSVISLWAYAAWGQVSVNKSINLSGGAGSARIAGIKDVSASQDALSVEALQKGSFIYAGTSSGTATAYTVSLTPAISGYAAGMVLYFRAHVANDAGPVTVNVNSQGAATVLKNGNQNLSDDDVSQDQLVSVIYDGSNFHLLSQVEGIKKNTVTANFGTGQSASFDVTGNGEIGGTLNVGGAVGIGNVNGSTAQLQVQGNEYAVYGFTGMNAGWGGYFHNTDGGGNRFAKLAGGTYAAVFMNGNVGIGTVTPSAKLEVQGALKIVDGTQAAGRILTSDANGNASWVNQMPAGLIFPFAGSTVPTGFLECNGQAVSRTTYASLFAVIGTIYGPGDGSTTFNLPDYRGYFLRGWNHGAANDPDAGSRTNSGGGSTGDNVGTRQDYQVQSHNHAANGAGSNEFIYNRGCCGFFLSPGSGSAIWDRTSVPVQNFGGNETRPKNINVMYCIRY